MFSESFVLSSFFYGIDTVYLGFQILSLRAKESICAWFMEEVHGLQHSNWGPLKFGLGALCA